MLNIFSDELHQKQNIKMRFVLVSQLPMFFLNLCFQIFLQGFHKGKNLQNLPPSGVNSLHKKAKSINQSYSLICAPLVLFLGLLMSKERQKATMGSSVFPFPSMLSFAA